MAAGCVDDIEISLQEAMSRLPNSHVPEEAIMETKNKKDDAKYQFHRRHSKLPSEPFSPHSKASRRRRQKPRNSANWASGGPGMQAFFLDSGQKSCGTGVFLPQRAGQSSSRPACSPVLLPSRVVQALNLNVHESGLQISPRPDPKNNNNNTKGAELNSFSPGKGKNASTKRCVLSQNENSSPEIFLPKEWTY